MIVASVRQRFAAGYRACDFHENEFRPLLVAENGPHRCVGAFEVRSGMFVPVPIKNGFSPFLLRKTRMIMALVRQWIAPVYGG